MALAPLLYNITFDSQTRILYFWDKAGHEIYHFEIPPYAPALPTVSIRGDFGDYNWIVNGTSGSSTTINAGSIWTNMYISGTTSTPRYKSSKSYAALYRTETNGGLNVDPTVISLVNGNPQIGVKNISSYTITLYAVRVAVCSDNTATVITVYDSSNTPYNAFQYTSDGTDYYYVLDGTQTDWTDDLSSIGYHLAEYLDLIVGISYLTFDSAWRAVMFSENEFWYCGILSQADADSLIDFGGQLTSNSNAGPIGNIKYDSQFVYEILAMYSDLGQTEIPDAPLSNFYIQNGGSSYHYQAHIKSINAYSTPVMSYKLRITKI